MLRHDDETIKAIMDTAERFAERELAEGVFERDSYPYHSYAAESFKRAGEAGLLFITAPEELGGTALPPEVWALALEKIAAADAGFAASLLAHALAAEAVLRHGNEEVKAAWIGTDPPKLLAYPLYLHAEDPQGLASAAKQDGGFLLTGAAALVANAPVADAAVVAAEMDDGNVGLFMVPLDSEARPEPTEMLGLRSCPVGRLDLVDVAVPQDHLLVRGADAVAQLHELFYPAAAAILIATHKASLDYAVEYGMERYQGGRMIHEHSQLRAMYGMMAVENIALREAWLRVLSANGGKDARLAVKVMAAELAIRGTMDGVQLLGGYGYTMEYPQEHRMRDARQAAELMGSPMRQKLTLIEKMIGGK